MSSNSANSNANSNNSGASLQQLASLTSYEMPTQHRVREAAGNAPNAGSSSRTTLSSGLANEIPSQNSTSALDLQQLFPARGRLGIEEIPFSGRDPLPGTQVPPPEDGWGTQAAREDKLQRFDNRSTQGINGGGRSNDYTRFQPQLVQYQQPDDASRITSFERNSPAVIKTNETPFV